MTAAEQTSMQLPSFLDDVLTSFVGDQGRAAVLARLRPADELMTAPVLSTMKATRVSFANVLARRMIDERWTIRKERFTCDEEGDAYGVYRINAGGFPLTYIARCYRWDGIEKVGRRADGAGRDMFGAIFLGNPNEARMAEEFAVFNIRDAARMRTRSDVTGWTPANRSVRYFVHVVDALVAGHQPDVAFLGSGTGYILRNGGYLGSGRQGSLSIDGLPEGHPFRHPFFADLFGLCLIRQVSIDLLNGVAKARNPHAPQLAPEIAAYIGVGNSSGQGMCVALQRWPEWVATWLTVRELSLAYSMSREVAADPSSTNRLIALLERVSAYLGSIELQSEDYVVPPSMLARNIKTIAGWLSPNSGRLYKNWGELSDEVMATFDRETTEQFNSLLIDLYPAFADAAADYLPKGMLRSRDVAPEMTVGDIRAILRQNYVWALRIDQRRSNTRQHFWYHSIDNGEQRRGERIIDPHEEFESFIDHIGLIQRLAAILATYDANATVAQVLVECPELYYGIARVQYLAGLPFAEIRDNLLHRDFLPAHLIRFYLSMLGIECTTPLSIRYVRGVFFQGLPLPEDISRGADPDWRFPAQPRSPELVGADG
jgi:hypothetical protein